VAPTMSAGGRRRAPAVRCQSLRCPRFAARFLRRFLPASTGSVSGLSNGGARDQDLLPATRRTRVNGHDRRADQADRMLSQRPDHLLTPLAQNQIDLALLVSHLDPSEKA